MNVSLSALRRCASLRSCMPRLRRRLTSRLATARGPSGRDPCALRPRAEAASTPLQVHRFGASRRHAHARHQRGRVRRGAGIGGCREALRLLPRSARCGSASICRGAGLPCRRDVRGRAAALLPGGRLTGSPPGDADTIAVLAALSAMGVCAAHALGCGGGGKPLVEDAAGLALCSCTPVSISCCPAAEAW